jgi:hypothetical protein
MLSLETDLAEASACVLLESSRSESGRRSLANILRDFWCASIHDQPSWPICGEYYCKKCWRRFRVPWANSRRTNQASQAG